MVTAIFLMSLCEPTLKGQSEGSDRHPNIIFIMADDLGWGDLGSYGQKRIRTPHLDRMAEEGMRFTQVYAGSTVCAPSRSVLMTGLHTGHTRVRGNARVPLQPGDRILPEFLKTAGYQTALQSRLVSCRFQELREDAIARLQWHSCIAPDTCVPCMQSRHEDRA